jgi:hypothetical protein
MEIFRGDPAPWREPMVAEAAERVAETLAQLHESEEAEAVGARAKGA